MDGCLRRTCPCLLPLWDRLTGKQKPGDGGISPGRGGSSTAGENREDTGRSSSEVPQKEIRNSGSNLTRSPSCLYRALWGFVARHEREMSFEAGDVLRVRSRGGDWWEAEHTDTRGRPLCSGFVPRNYLQKAEAEAETTHPWFFGPMNRFEAQGLLMDPENQSGAFLIRQSDRESVGFVLSVRCSVRVKHFRVLQSGGQFHVEPAPLCCSLLELVQYYSCNDLGSTGRLGQACIRKQPQLSPLDLQQWELPKEEFTLEEELGSGYFSDVYRGRWRGSISVAIKIIRSDSELDHVEFLREVQILKVLRHRHLISLFAVCTESSPFYIVTEFMEKGSLLDFLRGPEGPQQDVVSLLDMGAQVADGMLYLEEHRYIHRDLAARNVLVGDSYICKVADFGLGRVIKEPFYVTEDKKIPIKWSAPEAVSHGKFSSKSDVWSFGILLYEIITFGAIPYPGFTTKEVFDQVANGYRMPCPSKCPAFLYETMRECWSSDPDSRPSFRALKQRLENSIYEWELTPQANTSELYSNKLTLAS